MKNWYRVTPPKDESRLPGWKTRYARKAWCALSLFAEDAPVVRGSACQRYGDCGPGPCG